MPDLVLFAKAVIAAAIASALVTLAVAALNTFLRPKPSDAATNATTKRTGIAVVLGIGLGAAVGFYLLGLLPPQSLEGNFPHWSLKNVLDRFLVVIFPTAVVVELLGGSSPVPRWIVWTLRFGLAAGTGRVLLHESSYLQGSASDWTVLQAWIALGVGAGSLAGVWVLLAWLARRRPGISVALALSQTSLAAGMTVMLSGYLNGGAVGLPLSAALAGAVLAACLAAKSHAMEGPLGIGLIGIFSVLMMGRFFGDLSTGRAVTLMVAPLLCWASEIPFLRDRRPWVIATVQLALVAIPLAVVLGLAKHDFNRDNPDLAAVPSSTAATAVRIEPDAVREEPNGERFDEANRVLEKPGKPF